MQTSVSYNHQTVYLDGESFSGCEFVACRMIYAGGEPPQMDRCKFESCEWKFEGAAADTLALLKVMWGAGAKPAVQDMIKEITAVR